MPRKGSSYIYTGNQERGATVTDYEGKKRYNPQTKKYQRQDVAEHEDRTREDVAASKGAPGATTAADLRTNPDRAGSGHATNVGQMMKAMRARKRDVTMGMKEKHKVNLREAAKRRLKKNAR